MLRLLSSTLRPMRVLREETGISKRVHAFSPKPKRYVLLQKFPGRLFSQTRTDAAGPEHKDKSRVTKKENTRTRPHPPVFSPNHISIIVNSLPRVSSSVLQHHSSISSRAPSGDIQCCFCSDAARSRPRSPPPRTNRPFLRARPCTSKTRPARRIGLKYPRLCVDDVHTMMP